ncbi:hypothetical protein NBRC116594_06540 [Shimia sp. NS0008-38b]
MSKIGQRQNIDDNSSICEHSRFGSNEEQRQYRRAKQEDLLTQQMTLIEHNQDVLVDNKHAHEHTSRQCHVLGAMEDARSAQKGDEAYPTKYPKYRRLGWGSQIKMETVNSRDGGNKA